MDEKMKPCPFCGGRAYIVTLSKTHFVACSNLNCRANVGEYIDEEKAIKAWNRRVDDGS